MGCYLKSSEHADHLCATCANFNLDPELEPCYSCIYWPFPESKKIAPKCAWTPANPPKDEE